MNARLYLATAYASQYIPGAPSEQNIRLGTQAVNEFKEVLEVDPNNLSAIDGIGSIIFQMAGTPYDPKKFEESKSYHKKHIELKPNDPEPYYWIGVIDWTLAFRANGEVRAEYNKNNIKKQLKDTDPLPPALRAEYSGKYGALVDERSEEHTSELQSPCNLVCRLLLEKKKKNNQIHVAHNNVRRLLHLIKTEHGNRG